MLPPGAIKVQQRRTAAVPICGDDRVGRGSLSVALDGACFWVTTAVEGVEHVETARESRPDILPPVMLGGDYGGVEVFAVRKRSAPIIQTIVITGYAPPALQARIEGNASAC